jgi:type II secretory pathway pseudopilin PulG
MGVNLTEVLLGIAVSILVLAFIFFGYTRVQEGFRQSDTMQNVHMLRVNIDQAFHGNPFTGLDNALIITSDFAPRNIVRGMELRSPYGGAITVAAISAAQYTIELDNITQAGCQQIGQRMSAESWGNIEVNGTEILDAATGQVLIATLLQACNQARNTLIFTTP